MLGAAAGCSSLTQCDADPDLTGAWTFTLSPVADHSIPRADTLTAMLQQQKPSDVLGTDRRIFGSLASSDAGFFRMLTIPPLTHNDGSKTGAILECNLKINVPQAPVVTDDNSPQPPNKLRLLGTVDAKGHIRGDALNSIVLLDEDGPTAQPRHYAWTGARQ